MSTICACCGSNVPQAAYGCFACGAPRGETPGPDGVCPRCHYDLKRGARWCPGCNLAADKIPFGAPAASASPLPSAATAQTQQAPPETHEPANAHAPPPSQPAGAADSKTRRRLILGGGLGSVMILVIAAWLMQPPSPPLSASLATPSRLPDLPGLAPLGQAVPAQASAEAGLLADPIDGLFFQEFRQLLPTEYAAMIGGLLTQVPDPSRDMRRFNALLGERLTALRIASSSDIVAATDTVLDELADAMLAAMRAPEYCQAAIAPGGDGLDPANTQTRRLAAALNTSIVRAIASGRKHAIRREPPTRLQAEAFQRGLKKQLYDHQWDAFRTGAMSSLPPDEQCAIYVAHWTLIAGFAPQASAIWTADQMKDAGK